MLFQGVNRPIQIARGVLNPAAGTGEQGPPGNAATITIYDSTAGINALQGMNAIPFSRLLMSLTSSHDGGAGGVTFEGSEDNGLNWDIIIAAQSYLTANGMTQYDVLVSSPQMRVKYVNSANVLTKWRMSLQGIMGDRSKGS